MNLMSRLKLLGSNIKKYRKAKGLRQLDLAIAMNLSEDYICRVENGLKPMSLKKLFRLADVLEVKMTDLIDFN